MEEKKTSIKKEIIKNIIIILVITIIATSAIFIRTYNNYDEIWNFNFAKNVSDGLIPYKDFNMIATPLLSLICGLVLKIFGTKLIVMRVLAVILMCAIFYLTYKITEKLIPQGGSVLLLAVLISLFKNVMCIDYNYFTLLIALIITYLELKNIKEDYFEYSLKYNLLIGILAGIGILFKQTFGMCIAIAACGYKVLGIRKKDEIKPFFKIALTRLLGVIIPIVLLVIYLLINGAFKDFISYTILGIRTFTNKTEYSNLLKNSNLSNLAYGVPFFLVILLLMLFTKKIKPEIHILFAFAISSFSVVFPISDEIHFLIGSLITVIAAVYLIYEYVIKVYSKDLKREYQIFAYAVITFTSIMFLLTLVYHSAEDFINSYINVPKENDLAHFEGIPSNEAFKNRVKTVQKYILEEKEKGNKVYILDSEAAFYFIPLDIYNKDYDMFQKGNFGNDGENRLIKRISEEENAIYLLKQSDLNWQHPHTIRDYVVDNLNRTGEISYFDIYVK